MARETQERIPAQIWTLIAASASVALGYGIIAPILPQFALSFDVGMTAASGIVAAFSVMRLAFAPVGGGLVQRFGERRMYLIGISLVALSTGLVAFAQDYVQLLIFRSAGGIGSVIFTVSATGLLVRLSPSTMRGRTASLYSTTFLLGSVCGPVLGSGLYGLGYRVIFLSYALLLVASALVAAAFLRDRSSSSGTIAADERPIMTLGQAWRSLPYRASLLAGVANGWTNLGVRVTMLPLMAAAVPSLGAPLAGLALALFALGNAVTLQLSGRLVDHRGRRGVAVVGLIISGFATGAIGWATDPIPFLGLAALAGVGAAFLTPALQAVLADVIGSQRRGGPAIAATSMAADLGSIAGTLASGVLADLVGFVPAFLVAGTVMLLAAAPWALVREETPATTT